MIEPPRHYDYPPKCDRCNQGAFDFPMVKGFPRPRCLACKYVDMSLAPVDKKAKDERQQTLI